MGVKINHHKRAFTLTSDDLKQVLRDFPGGPVVENPPCIAGNAGSFPDQGTKIPHATEQLSLCAATVEPVFCN